MAGFFCLDFQKLFSASDCIANPFTTFIYYLKLKIMAKEKSPSKNSAKKEPVLSLKEKRAAKAAKKKNRS